MRNVVTVKRGSRCIAAAVVAVVLACMTSTAHASTSTHEREAADAVITWNANAGKAALAACIAPLDNPLHESRMYAMTHIAIHDALNAIDRRYTSYASDVRAPARSSARAAIAAAARGVLVPLVQEIPAPFPPSCIEAGVASVEADYATELASLPDNASTRRGLAVGEQAAAQILAKRADDGSDTVLIDSSYPQGTEPGVWRFTPDRPFAFAPGWAEVTPFVLRDGSQYRAQPPYEVTSSAYARDVREVQRLGGDGVTTPSERTAEQTEIALFWVESSPLAWNRIARTVATGQLGAWKQARLFALLNMALADGYIGSWDTKYTYNFWRPVTAIREAETDGNPRTTADPTWTPLRTTPPIPDYDSAHSVQGGAAAGVMRRFFGTDRTRFEACSLTLDAGSTCNDSTPVLRTFTRFSQAADENALSRILVGFHFRAATEAGLRHGDQIAERAVDRFLRPVR